MPFCNSLVRQMDDAQLDEWCKIYAANHKMNVEETKAAIIAKIGRYVVPAQVSDTNESG